MKRKGICTALAVLCTLLLTLSSFAETPPPLFFDESEAAAVDAGYDSEAHPVVWVFVALGVAALGTCGWMVYVNREKKPRESKEK